MKSVHRRVQIVEPLCKTVEPRNTRLRADQLETRLVEIMVIVIWLRSRN